MDDVLVVHGDDPSGDLLGGGEVTLFRVDDVGVPAEQAHAQQDQPGCGPDASEVPAGVRPPLRSRHRGTRPLAGIRGDELLGSGGPQQPQRNDRAGQPVQTEADVGGGDVVEGQVGQREHHTRDAAQQRHPHQQHRCGQADHHPPGETLVRSAQRRSLRSAGASSPRRLRQPGQRPTRLSARPWRPRAAPTPRTTAPRRQRSRVRRTATRCGPPGQRGDGEPDPNRPQRSRAPRRARRPAAARRVCGCRGGFLSCAA